DWTRRYGERLQQASSKVAWQDREGILFWRGSDTGCLHATQQVTTECGLWDRNTWPLFPRSKLVLASSLFPSRVDAVFTKDTVHKDCEGIYNSCRLRIEEIVPPEAHVRYKYVAYVDGTSFSDRLYWLLLTDSVVFRANSRIRVWLDEGLQAWKHYIPVREDLADLMDQLDWAKENDRRSAEIAADASTFAKRHLTLEGSLFYFYQVLLRLPGVIRLSPDELKHEPPALSVQNRVEEKATLDCWALGFTPEFCCNLDR
ncbi:Poglut2, partial [Symbiodinium pilosum]